MPETTFTVRPEILLKRIAATFPELEWTTYAFNDEGWDHAVIILDEKLVFRFPKDDEQAQLLENEIAVLRRLKPLVSLDIPQYSHVAPDVSFAGYPIVAGQRLSKELFDALPAPDRTAIAAQLAAFLSTLHTLIAQGHDFGSVMLSDIKEWQAHTKQQTEQHLRPLLTEEDFGVTHSILAETDELLARSLPTVFLHGDIYNQHILWDGAKKRLGVIDFSDMNRDDPAFDFAELYEYGDEFVREVYGAYRAPKDATFLQRAWTYQRLVGIYMMTDYFENYKTSFAVARETFDRVKGSATVAIV